jgi:ABC-2 type transport system ATP-binding protein
MADPAGEPAVEARGLTKAFDGAPAVEGIDLSVPKGEVFGLVGPDGAGKTTTLRMICGVIPPDAGRARVLGFDVASEADEVHRRIGYVPQRFGLYPELTVDENLDFRAQAYGLTADRLRERRESLLTFTRLGRFRRRPAAQLSGGMKQKLALAAALIHEPEALFLDEPTTGVDPVSRGEFWQMLLSLSSEGITVVLTTAYMDEAERCGRVGLLHRGRMLLSGVPAEVKRTASLSLLQVACQPITRGREVVEKLPGVHWVEIFGDRLHVAVERPGLADEIERALKSEGIACTIRAIEPTMEDAFFELVRRQEQA